MSNAITEVKTAGMVDLSPQTFEQALTFANYLADSDMVPKDFKGKPGNCLIAMQWGTEVGLKPLQSIQNIAVINGRPALWGDSVIALVRASPVCEYIIEEDNGHTATCKVKRRGEPEQVRAFSMDDAKQAGLLGKQGPWMQYPKRMRQMRARAFAMRDVFPDVLRGMPVAEEVMDAPKDMGPAEEVGGQSAGTGRPTLPEWPADAFAVQAERWGKAVSAGLKTVDDILALARSKGALSAAQEAQIRAFKKAEAPDANGITDVQPKNEPAQPGAPTATGDSDLPWED